jgi:hypothetical protein
MEWHRQLLLNAGRQQQIDDEDNKSLLMLLLTTLDFLFVSGMLVGQLVLFVWIDRDY